MKYSGIDLHSNNSVVTVTDDSDRVVAEKRLPNDLRKIVDFLTPWREELVGVVVESTFNWYWLVEALPHRPHHECQRWNCLGKMRSPEGIARRKRLIQDTTTKECQSRPLRSRITTSLSFVLWRVWQ